MDGHGRHCSHGRLVGGKMQGTHGAAPNHIARQGLCPQRLWFGSTLMPSRLHSDRMLIVTREIWFELCGLLTTFAAHVKGRHCN